MLVSSICKATAWQVLYCLGLIPSGESCSAGIKTYCSELCQHRGGTVLEGLGDWSCHQPYLKGLSVLVTS